MNFILDYTFDEILAWKTVSDSLEVLKLFQFHPECLLAFNFFLDQKNLVSLEMRYSRPITVDKSFFEGLPPSIFLSQNLLLTGLQGTLKIPLISQVEAGGNDRVLVAKDKIDQIETVLFENVFGELLPAAMSSKAKVELFLNEMRLMEVIDFVDGESIHFQYFDNSWPIKKQSFRKDCDFEFKSKNGDVGLQITMTDGPQDFEIIDAKSAVGTEIKKALNDKLPRLRQRSVGLIFRFWDKKESYCSTNRRVISTRKQKLIEDARGPIDSFLDSKIVASRAQKIRKKIDAASVKKLDKRKNTIVDNKYLMLPNKTRFKVPGNEYETVILFSGLIGAYLLPFHSFEILEYSSSEGVDSICSYKIESDDVLKKEVAVEFEYKLSNFFKHEHPPQHVELIICWAIDIMRQSLGKTDYPWLFRLADKNTNLFIVEISSFDLGSENNDSRYN